MWILEVVILMYFIKYVDCFGFFVVIFYVYVFLLIFFFIYMIGFKIGKFYWIRILEYYVSFF